MDNVEIYYKKYPENLTSLLHQKNSKIFFDYLSDGVICNFREDNLISIIIFVKLKFPYKKFYEFHVEMFTNNKFKGLTSILKSLEILEEKFGSRNLVSRHSLAELQTLLMLNDLDYFPIEYSYDDPRIIIVKKYKKVSLDEKKDKDAFVHFIFFIKNWLKIELNFYSIDSFISEYGFLLKKNKIYFKKLSQSGVFIIDEDKGEGIIFFEKKVFKKDLMQILNSFSKKNIHSIYINKSEIRLTEVLFLMGYNNSYFESKCFVKWVK
jgi:hypothetical protein